MRCAAMGRAAGPPWPSGLPAGPAELPASGRLAAKPGRVATNAPAALCRKQQGSQGLGGWVRNAASVLPLTRHLAVASRQGRLRLRLRRRRVARSPPCRMGRLHAQHAAPP